MSGIALASVACSRPVAVTGAQRRAATAAIAVVLDSMNAAWRRADFTAADQPLLSDGVVTFNGSRQSGASAKAEDAGSPTTAFTGQYISPYTIRYDVLSPGVAVTSWENDFARIGADHAQQPMQTALMTIVWKRTAAGWGILAYHESTRPKEREPAARSLLPYTGTYVSTGERDARVTVVAGALNVALGDAKPTVLTAFTDPDFGMDGVRVTFVRASDRTVQGVLLERPDGSSRYAWRISANGARASATGRDRSDEAAQRMH